METRLFAAFFIAASLIFLVVMVPALQAGSSANPMFQTPGLGPAAIPYFAGGAVLLLSVAIFFQRPPAQPGPAPEPEVPASRERFAPLALFVAIFTGFLVLLPIIGFLFAAMAFLAAVFLTFRAKSPIAAAAVTVCAPLAIDLLLRKVFLIPLPQFGWF